MFYAIAICGALVCMLSGFGIAKLIDKKHAKEKQKHLQARAEAIIAKATAQADAIKEKRIAESKQKYNQLKHEHEERTRDSDRRIREGMARLKQKEADLDHKSEQLARKTQETEQQRERLNRQLALNEQKSQELDEQIHQTNEKLVCISGMDPEEARKKLIENIRNEVASKTLAIEKEIIAEATFKANKEACRIVLQTIQRVAAEQTIENVVTSFPIQSDDIKGQIIGREGRNIRAIEAATGVDLIIDDTPGVIVLSCFDPLRREIARLSLERLVADGRIHPVRIEEVVEKTRSQMEQLVMEVGERTAIEIGVHGLHRELVRLVGKMRFRSSYGQNLLSHSREVANLCAIMAAEMNVCPKLAKRAGLLHDIGKVCDSDGTENELSHAILGMKLCEKYGESHDVVNAVGAHHDEIEMESLIAPIVQACDSISGARPGARQEITQQYIQRIKDLEDLAMSYEGVEKAFAMQAGRELRITVQSDRVSDEQVSDLSYQIASQIQNNMVYPGQIKVTVIREKRVVAVAH